MKPLYALIAGLGIVLALAGVGAYAVFGRPYTYQGSQIDPPLAVGDFTLTGLDGKPVKLSELRNGKQAALVFFGYTHCTDVCPATMSDYRKVKAQLGSQAGQVLFLFITVDPERDTPQVTGQYAANFDPAFVGLSGSRADLEPVWKTFGVYQAQQPADSSGNYDVEHSSTIYALGPQGDVRLTFPLGTDPKAIASDLEHLMKG
jgi:protein SCO1/2